MIKRRNPAWLLLAASFVLAPALAKARAGGGHSLGGGGSLLSPGSRGSRSFDWDAAEMWTFARSPGGHWLLSAVQPV